VVRHQREATTAGLTRIETDSLAVPTTVDPAMNSPPINMQRLIALPRRHHGVRCGSISVAREVRVGATIRLDRVCMCAHGAE
jgi:hypothetical protein